MLILFFFSFSIISTENIASAHENYESINESLESCWVPVWFKNEGCTTAGIYENRNGNYVYYATLKKHESYKVTAQKGSEWAITKGYNVKKRWWVSHCSEQSVKIDLGGCHNSHDTYCGANVSFKNSFCHTLSVYHDDNGHHTHYKDIAPKAHWNVSTKKGQKWIIKHQHTVKKRWTVASCGNQYVDLNFNGCNYGDGGHSTCSAKVRFNNHFCHSLGIYYNKNGHHKLYTNIAPNQSWSVNSKKGEEWIIKHGHTVKKRWHVSSCGNHSITLDFGGCSTTTSNCSAKVGFKNNNCGTLGIYYNNNGHHTHYKNLPSNGYWSTNTKKGHEWIIKDGHTIKKRWHVPSCGSHNVNLNFAGCSEHNGQSSCYSKVGFKNKHCKSLSIYWDNNGHHVHYKNLAPKAEWWTSTKKGHQWVIKEGSQVMKRHKVTTCSQHLVNLSFGNCHNDHNACNVNVGFFNKNCKKLSIYWKDGHKLVHYKDLVHNGYWRVRTKQGHQWVIKHGDVTMKYWTVSHCDDINLSLNYGGCDELCSDGSKKQEPDTSCDDYDSNTENDVVQEDGCTCAGTQKNATDDCEMSYDTYESGWGNWYDGGAHCSRHYSSHGPMHGKYSVQLRANNGWASSTYSVAMNMHTHKSVKVDFVYMTTGLSHNEAFALEYSPNDGHTWYSAKKWYKGSHFNNNKMYQESISFNSTFGKKTRLRFRSYTSSHSHHIYLDDVKISSCAYNDAKGDNSESSIGKSKEIDVISPIELSVFPNPAVDRIHINGLSDDESFDIYSIDGRVVISNNTVSTLNVSQLIEGTYFLRSTEGKVAKFIKQ
ncbi:MAG: T9SS type A sorting domain-containing protein [Saprospiraceae bacterium]